MFDIGFTEILLIGIVALVVIGPERLPAVARTVGLWIGKLQRFVTGVKSDLASELETGDLKKLIGDQRQQINELKGIVTSAAQDLQKTTQGVMETTRESLSELETTVNGAKAENEKPSVTQPTADQTPIELGKGSPSADSDIEDEADRMFQCDGYGDEDFSEQNEPPLIADKPAGATASAKTSKKPTGTTDTDAP